MIMVIIIILILTVDAQPRQKKYCHRGESCWPTINDIGVLRDALNKTQPRVLKWDGQGNPRVCSVPIGSPDEQPLYGFGVEGLDALYYELFNPSNLCFSEPIEFRLICYAAIRNNPTEGWSPGFVVWALSVEDVQTAVRFAVKHNLCISVLGTGHDFMNRHSCSDGVLIRTTLLKDIEWDLDDKKGFGNVDGNVKYGSGIVFSESHKSASDNDRFVASGWAITVGIAGWSIGGGHGPFGNTAGLGVDNILEVDIVIANGDLITANSKNNTDLFWAIRGGGGSTWGVITALTLKAHKIPDRSITYAIDRYNGTFCDDGKNKLHTLIDEYLMWAITLDYRWSGMTFITPNNTGDPSQCNGTWIFERIYVFQGPPGIEVNDTWFSMTYMEPLYVTGGEVANWWEVAVNYSLEPIIPVQYMKNNDSVGSVPSVLVGRDMVASGLVATTVKAGLDICPETGKCNRHEFYQAITGNIGSPQDPNVSIPPGFRKALFHLVVGGNNQTVMDTTYYALGENSYFSESAYEHTGDSWKQRYWGKNYDKLLKIKQKWDPDNVFWCRHCVGSDL